LKYRHHPFFLPLLFCLVLGFGGHSCAQPPDRQQVFTEQDTLRGSIGPGRDWWDVLHYAVSVTPDYTQRTIEGKTTIRFRWLRSKPVAEYMQIDLQEPMQLDSAVYRGNKLAFKRNKHVYLVSWPGSNQGKEDSITLYFHGKPRTARNPPWDGGWVWAKDAKGRPWMTVACQGLGASVWYPCKDHQGDEPDQGATLSITVADSLTAVGNGRLKEKKQGPDGSSTWIWEVKSPINNYNIVPYIGKYQHWSDEYTGETGDKLSLDYFVLDYNLEKSKKQFGRDVKPMLEAFEFWFGPYPFYKDGFKLVESSHLGMEHQSAIAYGNHYRDGYLGRDLSGSGWGLKWDYIIVHEAGHEWFANNITTRDIADMWVHEGFTMYSEPLFIEYHYGKKAADEYVRGIRRNISNDRPLIGPYGVNQEGSGDMYNKGANLLHTIRQVIHDDTVFRKILRGLNKEFYHTTIDSKDVEAYFSKQAGTDLSKIFDQYLRTTLIPVLEYRVEGDKLSYRWANCIKGFDMPVKLDGIHDWLNPTETWKTVSVTAGISENGLTIDKNFYIVVKKVE